VADEPVLSLSGPTASTQAAVTYGPYVRAELGGMVPELADGNWLPPGPADPRIFFDLDGDNSGLAAIAFGFDWQNGFRGDLSIMHTGSIGFSGPCSSASDGSPCDRPPAIQAHADITDGSVRSTAVMANLFYAPLEARGSNSRFQPFVVGGIGMSRNTVESWTRFNLDAGTPPGSGPATRVFGENSENQFAWSVGLGASWQLTEPGERPILLDVGWRYYDFGTAEGGSTADVGAGIPRQPLNFDPTSQVFSIGIRIPLQRY
jgi:opacity protein-like surface antigen